MTIDLQELALFLNEANKCTYANKSVQKTDSTRSGSEDYHFQKGNFTYHDTYFGSRDFIGEEIIYRDGLPIWGMNYYGYLLKEEVSEKEVYDFLRQSLMQESLDPTPVRGPSRYDLGPWTYSCTTDGTLERFRGTEVTLLDGEEVYRCWYHGGLIS